MNHILRVVSLVLIISASACSPKMVSTSTGLEYTLLKKNKKGKLIEKGMEVEAHCILTLKDGTKVWSTYDDNRTFKFKYGSTRMIDGFNEIISYMHEGEKVQVMIPSEQGYGSRGRGEAIPPNSDLIFEITVLNAN